MTSPFLNFVDLKKEEEKKNEAGEGGTTAISRRDTGKYHGARGGEEGRGLM
jgi:hypothetical protein